MWDPELLERKAEVSSLLFHDSYDSQSQRAENWGLDPSWLIFAFLGRPDFL